MSTRARQSIRVAQGPEGIVTYLIDLCPPALPPVRSGDLDEAWRSAREAAADQRWGSPRLFRFAGDDGPIDLALTDDDASCWTEAIDRSTGLDTVYGLSLCIRLLALVDLLATASWAEHFFRIDRAGAALDPALLRVAATEALTVHASFDEPALLARLGRDAPSRLPLSDPPPGVLC